MLAIYDLGVSPPTYDFASFLLAAECYRLDLKQTTFRVVVVRGPKEGFRDDSLPPDGESRRRMFNNVVIPMASMIPSCMGIDVIERRELPGRMANELVFPPDYRIDQPKAAYGLGFMAMAAKRGVFPFFTASLMPGYKDAVTITLRQAGYWPTRDSDLPEWLTVARELRERGKRVIFVPDANGHYGLDGFEVNEQASTGLAYRLSLYASCSNNLFVSNGPAWLAAFCPQITGTIFKIFAPGAPCVDPEFFAKCGFPEGSQIGRPGFKIVWKDDTAETILDEMDKPAPPAPFAYPNVGNTKPDFFLNNMRDACKRDLPWFVGKPRHTGVMVICGGGPSIKENLNAIRDRRRRGQTIVAVNNSWRLLVKHNIMPDIVMAMDARPENAAFFQDAPEEPDYWIASSCHASVFDALEGRKVTVWHPDQCQDEQKRILDEHQDKPGCLIGGGATIGIRAMIVGFVSGYRSFHLYGLDSSYRGQSHHAYEQTLNDGAPTLTITALGKPYICAPWMARQADEFQRFRRTLVEKGCFIQAHGYGLIPDLSRHHNKLQAIENQKEIA